VQARCVPGSAGGAGRGFIGVDRRRGPPGPRPPGGGRDPGELAQHRGPVNRDVMAAGQVRGLRAGLRPVAGSRPDMRRELALGHRPAARALLRLLHVLGAFRLRGWPDIGDLMPPRRRHRLAGQARAAAAARRRRAVIALIMRAIRGRRARGRGRVLARLPLKLINPRRSRSFSAVSRSICPVSSAISRYSPASRTASPAAGCAGCSAEGRQERRTQLAMITIPARQSNNAPWRVTGRRHDLAGHDRPRDPAPRRDRALRSLTQRAGLTCSSPAIATRPSAGGRAWRSQACEEDASTS
jgi:hypothetical protein